MFKKLFQHKKKDNAPKQENGRETDYMPGSEPLTAAAPEQTTPTPEQTTSDSEQPKPASGQSKPASEQPMPEQKLPHVKPTLRDRWNAALACVCPRLDRYLIWKFLSTYFFLIVIIITIAVLFDYNEKIDKLSASHAPWKKIIFDYYLNFVPYFSNLFSPPRCLWE